MGTPHPVRGAQSGGWVTSNVSVRTEVRRILQATGRWRPQMHRRSRVHVWFLLCLRTHTWQGFMLGAADTDLQGVRSHGGAGGHDGASTANAAGHDTPKPGVWGTPGSDQALSSSQESPELLQRQLRLSGPRSGDLDGAPQRMGILGPVGQTHSAPQSSWDRDPTSTPSQAQLPCTQLPSRAPSSC